MVSALGWGGRPAYIADSYVFISNLRRLVFRNPRYEGRKSNVLFCIHQVQDLKYATLATVSRCGMVWFSEDVLSTEMIFENYLARLRNIPLEEGDEDTSFTSFVIKKQSMEASIHETEISPSMQVRRLSGNFRMKYMLFEERM